MAIITTHYGPWDLDAIAEAMGTGYQGLVAEHVDYILPLWRVADRMLNRENINEEMEPFLEPGSDLRKFEIRRRVIAMLRDVVSYPDEMFNELTPLDKYNYFYSKHVG